MQNDLDLVMDALVGILRDFGRYSFDLERIDARKAETQFDQWAQHLLTGVEAPGIKGLSGTLAQRHWNELRQAFVSHRRSELTEVSQSQDALLSIVWNFVSSLNQVASEDDRDQTTMSNTLTNLSNSLQTAPAADIKRIAFDAVAQVQTLLASRKERQHKQMVELGRRVESLGSQLEVARRESTVDPLTQIFNRRAFDEHCDRTVELSLLSGTGAALMLLDIDHFKKVNDTWGHPSGDAVLQAVAQTSVRVFKRKNDFVARYGGEEFAIIVRDVTLDEALSMARRLREAINALVVSHGEATLRVTASIGVASWILRETAADWIKRADSMLYRAKSAGRDRVEG